MENLIKRFFIVLFVMCSFSVFSKTAVIFYSYSGNTKSVAEKIAKELEADIFEVTTVTPYSKNYREVVDQGKKEVDSGFLPAIKKLDINFLEYDNIILASPVWWYAIAPAMSSFLNGKEEEFKGKNVWAFTTHGGWKGHSLEDFKKACSKANIKGTLDLHFNSSSMRTKESLLDNWINEIKKAIK